MRIRPYILGCAFLVLAASVARADSPPPNLIVNGGFETGNFSGWTLSGSPGYSFVSGVMFADDHPNSGSYYAMLGSAGAESFLSQTVATTSGSDYALTFYLSSDGAQVNELSVAENGDTLLDLMNIPDTGGYKEYTVDFTADASSTTVSLGSRDDPSYLLLDDVSLVDPGPQIINTSVTETPLPGSLWLGGSLMAAMGLTTLLRRRSTLI
jgi:hypothetical protein